MTAMSASAENILEAAQRLDHRVAIEVDPRLDLVETGARQGGAQRRDIPRRILQRRDAAIAGIADQKRDPFVREGGVERQEQETEGDAECREAAPM